MKDLNTLAADVIKKGEALYAKLSTEQIDFIKENLENDNASGYSEVADEVEDQELSDQLRMLGLEVYSCQNNRSPMYDDVSSYIDDMEYSYDTLHSSELKLSSMKILLKMALVTHQDGFFADDFVRLVFGRLDDYDAESSRSFTKCAIDALISNALDSKECAACYCTARDLARRSFDSDGNIDFDINVIKELFSSAIDKCKTTEDFFFARGAIRNAYLDPDIGGELLSRIPDDLVALDIANFETKTTLVLNQTLGAITPRWGVKTRDNDKKTDEIDSDFATQQPELEEESGPKDGGTEDDFDWDAEEKFDSEAFLEENLDEDWDENFDYGDHDDD